MAPQSDVLVYIHDETRPLIAKKNSSKRITQPGFLYFSAISVGLLWISGASFGIWTSPVLKKLKSNNTDENPLGSPITTYQTSVLAGMLTFGNMLAPSVLKLLIDTRGRKMTLQILGVITCLGSIVIAYSQNFELYCIFRGIIGLCMGASSMVIPIYITEITEDHNRGRIGVMMGIFNPLGHLYGYVMGPLLSVRSFTLICALPLLISLFLIGCFLPDSPVHLISRGENQKALNALKKLRNRKHSKLEEEISIISKKLKNTNIEHKGIISLLKNRPFRRGFFMILGLKITVPLSGMMAISSFIGPIFNDAHVGIPGDLVAVILAMVEIITFFFISYIIEKVGRRALLLVSTSGSAICQLLIGYYFHLKSINYCYLQYFTWLPVVSVVLFYISFAFGLGCVPRILLSEIFPSNVRATAVAVISFVMSVFLFCVMFAFPILQSTLGNAYCFWFCSLFCCLGFVYVYFIVPETKGKNIIELMEESKEPI